jgi:hypothetical protein
MIRFVVCCDHDPHVVHYHHHASVCPDDRRLMSANRNKVKPANSHRPTFRRLPPHVVRYTVEMTSPNKILPLPQLAPKLKASNVDLLLEHSAEMPRGGNLVIS